MRKISFLTPFVIVMMVAFFPQSRLYGSQIIDISGSYLAEGEKLPSEKPPAYPEFNWVDRMIGKEILVGEPGSSVVINQTSCTGLSFTFISASGKLSGSNQFSDANASLQCTPRSVRLRSSAGIQGEGFTGAATRIIKFELDPGNNLIIDAQVESTSSFFFVPVKNATQFYKARFRRVETGQKKMGLINE